MKTLNVITRALSLMLALVLAFSFFLILFRVPAYAAETEGDICFHEFTPVVYEPTCSDKGYTIYECDFCDDYYIADYVDPLGHEYTSSVVEATCVKDGYTLFQCIRCDVSYSENIPATGIHDYNTEVVDATCTEDGYTTYTCVDCGHSYTETILAGHDYELTFVDPTCEEDGLVIYTCTVCGDTFTDVDTENPAIGHIPVITVIAPTCTEDGYTKYSCENCGLYFCNDFVDAVGHSYTATYVAPTCTQAGGTVHTCSDCGHSYTSDPVNATGHSYTTKIVCGNAVYTCNTCGYSYTKTSSGIDCSRVTKFTSGKSYVITVYNGGTPYALTHANNTVSSVKISVSGGTVKSQISDDMLWTYSSGKLYYENDGVKYYLRIGPASSGTGYYTLSLSTTTSSNISYSSNKLRIGSSYLKYNNGTIKAYRSSGITYLMERKN